MNVETLVWAAGCRGLGRKERTERKAAAVDVFFVYETMKRTWRRRVYQV